MAEPKTWTTPRELEPWPLRRSPQCRYAKCKCGARIEVMVGMAGEPTCDACFAPWLEKLTKAAEEHYAELERAELAEEAIRKLKVPDGE